MKTLTFDKTGNAEFSKILRMRVNDYFKKNNKNIYGNGNMVFKTVFMLSIFFLPLITISTGLIASPFLLFALYITSGLGMAGVGMGVMHDAIHGSYSKHKSVNKYVGYTMNLIGANASVWRIQHNVLHHTYTNIDHADDDINAPFFLRFSPHAKRYWIHRFQYLYIWLFYGLSTISWITMKDFVRINRYKEMGFFKRGSEFKKEILKIIGWKMLYYSYALVLPLIMVPLPAWIIILAFLSMHFVTGICISAVFQTAHIVSDTSFPQPDDTGQIHGDWTVHQLATTSNYAPKSRFFSWLIGGLNFQIEHHLFPNISHIHYHNLSSIVSETAEEYNIPYLVKDTFLGALGDHIKMLRQLGRA
ncbi:acyl-CoA desaturase [Algoriphagus sp. D3-2-R+10]|uniref:fatty acid desaturase family protein n=1 Tax=Algoriphagus aurantiacus TaxID=3103948 RepID=UPI002B3860AC|nr:acyl-CoA desaturase [Algoriphagus sp. D3-2-R+10]MEB2775690.1 acyl-CoA desaturase [Algoriphagus sp. D3-2-R+10]